MSNSQKKVAKNAFKALPKPAASSKPSKKVAKNIVAVSRVLNPRVEEMREVEALLKAFSAPRDFPPVRLSNGWSSFDTAVASVYYRQQAKFAALSVSTQVGDCTAFVFRDAARAFVTLTYTTQYLYRYTSPSVNLSDEAQQMRFGRLTAVSTNQPHGVYMYPGVLEGQSREYYWLGGKTDNTRAITITNNYAAGSITAYLWMYRQGVSAQVATLVINAGAFQSFLPTEDAYYALDFKGPNILGSYTVEWQQTGSTLTTEWAHYPLPYLQENIVSMDSFKIYSAALMYTNDASPLNRQGKIAGVQIPKGRSWTDFQVYSTIAQQNEAVSMNAENGLYGFLKPTQPEDFNFKDRDTISLTGGVAGAADVWFQLRPDSDFLAISCNITTPGGQDGYWTPAWHFEYRTVDQWRSVDSAKNTDDEVEVAIKLLAAMPQWHENPFHISDIFNYIGDKLSDAYETAKKWLPSIVGAATTAAKVGTAIIPLL